ncbi:aldolase/citrate lyase family protein [Rhodococcus koreensis]|uniref:aldolase/citrate lyase family protein n=1 Tax=Rhodococcus koreensis TaxID=99653 RepID=UPI00366C3A19
MEAIRDAPGLIGVLLAKTESAEDVAHAAAVLPGVPIVAMVESARSLTNSGAIAAAEPVVRLAFGVGDFGHDTGFPRTPLALAHARSRRVVASSAAAIPGPIDGPIDGPTTSG